MEKEKQVVTQISEQKAQLQNGDKEVSNVENLKNKKIIKRGEKMKNKNPHNICTWDEQADCASCGIQGELHCKWDKKILNGFYATSVSTS